MMTQTAKLFFYINETALMEIILFKAFYYFNYHERVLNSSRNVSSYHMHSDVLSRFIFSILY